MFAVILIGQQDMIELSRHDSRAAAENQRDFEANYWDETRLCVMEVA